MTRHRVLALGTFVLILVFLGLWLLLLLVDPIPITPPDLPWVITQLCFAIGYGSFGAFLASRRPRNSIGWLFLATGVASASLLFAGEYAVRGVLVAPGSLPAALAVGMVLPTLAAIVWPSFIFMIVALYPTGRPAAKRWWSAIVAAAIFGLLFSLSSLLSPGPVGAGVRSLSLGVPNPMGIPLGVTLTHLRNSPLLLLPLVLAVAAVVDRWRRASGEERHQLKWLTSVCVLLLLVFFPYGMVNVGRLPHPDWLGALIAFTMLFGFTVGIPGAITVAILRYHLYDIDVVISRALLYGVLAAFITAVYVGTVVGLGTLIGAGGQLNLLLSIVATAVVAVAFAPVRERVQRLANRLVYGQRATPYEVLTDFSHRIAGAVANEEIMPRMARVLVEGTAATGASVWLRQDGHRVLGATWPESAPAIAPEEADRDVVVRHLGEVLGDLAIKKRAGDSLTPVEEKLLKDVAAQAGQVLRNVRLTAELQTRLEEISQLAGDLRESRQRIVAAQDAERRRLERNIHDGAQQHLVALAVKFRLAAGLARKDKDRAITSIAELRRQARDALETLNTLAAGLNPLVLQEHGIAAALRSQAGSSATPLEVIDGGIPRYAEELEAAVYFCCLEALQNVAKSADASSATVRLSASEGVLAFAAEDDGKGFDPTHARDGSGLQNMADRIQALGGKLTIRSAPGKGTRISGTVPAQPRAVDERPTPNPDRGQPGPARAPQVTPR